MTLIPKPNNSKTISDFLITKYLPDMLVYDHTTPQSGCFWTEAGGRKRNLFYISKLTEPEYDNLVLQNIDISQQYTGWKKKNAWVLNDRYTSFYWHAVITRGLISARHHTSHIIRTLILILLKMNDCAQWCAIGYSHHISSFIAEHRYGGHVNENRAEIELSFFFFKRERYILRVQRLILKIYFKK